MARLITWSSVSVLAMIISVLLLISMSVIERAMGFVRRRILFGNAVVGITGAE